MKKIIILFSLLVLSGCGGGDGGVSDNVTADGLTGGWVKILTPTTNPSTTYCDNAFLDGEAFVSNNNYVSPFSGSAEEITGVSVTWKNLSANTTGQANQRAFWCPVPLSSYLAYPCMHSWYVNIPLELGDNIIEITATDANGSGDTNTITVYKPEYSYEISGTLSTHQNVTFSTRQSGVGFSLSDGIEEKTSSVWFTDGQFKFTCVPNGSYTLTPTSQSFNFVFTPQFYSVSVTDLGVSSLEFKTEAYSVSGVITDSTGRPETSEVYIKISNADGELSSLGTQDDGSYSFIVPNGSYKITPFCYSLACTFSPQSINVDVINGNVAGQDFIVY